jgi:hypothetical protein
MSPTKTSGGSILLAMPSRPEASEAASARYGLQSAPGMRHSMRVLAPEPTMRKPAVRLSLLQARRVGAHEPST